MRFAVLSTSYRLLYTWYDINEGAQHSLDKKSDHEKENKDDSNNRSNRSGCVVL
jgi:hypothetical protein